MYPPFWMVDRFAIDDDRLKESKLAGGTTIVAFLYGCP